MRAVACLDEVINCEANEMIAYVCVGEGSTDETAKKCASRTHIRIYSQIHSLYKIQL